MSNSYDIGDVVSLVGTFTDVNGQLADPGTVTCRMRQPDDSVVDVAVSRVTQGVFSGPFSPTMAGLHIYRFTGTDGLDTAEEQALFVRAERVGPVNP